jgi:hypothetical protein
MNRLDEELHEYMEALVSGLEVPAAVDHHRDAASSATSDRRRSRALVAAAMLVVVAVIAVVIETRDERSSDPDPSVVVGPGEGEWRELPPSPLHGRIGASSVWTGKELVVVGGAWHEPTPFGERVDVMSEDPTGKRT